MEIKRPDDIGMVGITGTTSRCKYCDLPLFGIGMQPHRAYQCESCDHVENVQSPLSALSRQDAGQPFDCSCDNCELENAGKPPSPNRRRRF